MLSVEVRARDGQIIKYTVTVIKPGVEYFDTADYKYVTTESRMLFGRLKRLLKR